MRVITVNTKLVDSAKAAIIDRKNTIVLEVVPVNGSDLATIVFDYVENLESVPIKQGSANEEMTPGRSMTVAQVKEKFRTLFGFECLPNKKVSQAFVKRVLRNRLIESHWMAVVSFECKGKAFWRAVLTVLERIEDGTYKTSWN